MDTEEKRRIGYIKREHYAGTSEACDDCAYGHTKVGDTDDRPCSKHNMMVGAADVCNDFEDWWEVTEEGRKWRASIQNFAAIHLKRLEEEKNKDFQKSEENSTITGQEEKVITTGQFVLVGSLFSGMLFNSIMDSFMEWGIKEWCLTYVVAAVIVGIGTFTWYIIKNKIVNRRQ